MKRKYFILFFSIFIIAILIFYNYTFVAPIKVVDNMLKNSKNNNLLYGLTSEQFYKINDFKTSSMNYGFPAISFDDKIDWKLSKRFVMVKKRIWLKKNISLDKYILYMGKQKEGFHDVKAIIDYEVYDPEMVQGYTHIGSYSGKIYFRLKKTGLNKWRVEEITVSKLKP